MNDAWAWMQGEEVWLVEWESRSYGLGGFSCRIGVARNRRASPGPVPGEIGRPVEERRMKAPRQDRLTIDGTEYTWRTKYWVTPNGYCVSTAHSQMLTKLFYEKNGRVPGTIPARPAAARPAAPARGASRLRAST